MATRGAVLRGAMSIPGGARPTPAPQGSGMSFNNGRAMNAPSIGQPSPLTAQLANDGGGYNRMYGGFLPRPTGDFTAGAFGPFSPILPVPVDEPPDGATRPEARRFEYQVGWNLPVGQPGQEGLRLTSFETMRRLADVYSVARACIEHRKNQIKGMDWDIIPTPEAAKAYQQSPSQMADFGKRRAKALKFFKRPDTDYMTFSSWISVMIEEVLVYDALSLLMRPVRGKGRGKGVLGSDFASFMTVHGPTIRPLLNLHGGTPRPPAPAYQQYLYGVPRSDYLTMITQDDIDDAGLSGSEVGSFRGDQLLYMPSVPRAWTPYGFSAIERALIPIMTGLQKQGFQYDWFAESTVPSAYIIPGDTAMTPNQLRELQDALNAIAGDPAWKQKIIVLPPNSKVEPQRPGSPADELDQLLFTETCMAFGLSPMEIGVTPGRSSSMGAQNQMAKMSQKTSEDSGLTPLLKFFQDIFNMIITQVCNQEDMLFTFEGLQEEEDVESLTGVLVQQVQNGLRTVDEARQELNMQPYGLEETTEPLFVTPNGPVPLSTAIKNAESAAAQQEAQAQQTQAGVAQTHANIAQSLAGAAATQAGTQSTQQNTEATRSRLQMQQESHEVSMNEPGAPQMQERSQQHQSAMAQQAQRAQQQQAGGKPTPGRAAASAGNREAASTKKSLDPVLMKRQAAEYGALVRHLVKGRPVSTWEAKFIAESVLADVAKGMAHGLAPADAVSAAKARSVRLPSSEYEWVTRQVGERLATTHNGAVKVADAGPKAGEFDFIAFGEAGSVQKAAGPNRTWPGWQRDLELVQHYVPKITQAFQDGMAAARAFLNNLFSGGIRVTATWAAQEIRSIMAAAMKRALEPLWTEGYALGRASAVHAVTGLLDWGSWEPGDLDAAALVADGAGLKRLLEQWGINVIQSISETRMDDLAQQIAQALVDGDSSDTLAHNIEEMLNVPRRARMIAQTELARAVTVATLDTYNETGVERKQWLIAPDESVCPKCRAAEAEGGIPLTQAFEATGKDGPPAHPHCRCTTIPADTHGFDLSDMVSEPLPDFATVPLQRQPTMAMAKRARVTYCDQGHKHRGPGAAGILIRAPRPDGTMTYLLQQRDKTADQPFTWSTFGGTLHVGESPRDGAMREVEEETGVKPGEYQLGPKTVDDHGGWAYTTYVADAPKAFWPSFDGSTPEETADWGWFTPDEMRELDLHPAFEANLDDLLDGRRAEKVGPKGYIHGWIKVGADGKPDVKYEAASPESVSHGDVIRVAVHHNQRDGVTAIESGHDVPGDADERLLHVDKVVNGIVYSGHDENGAQHSVIMPDGDVQRVTGKPQRPEPVEKPEDAKARLDAVVASLGPGHMPSFEARPFNVRADGWNDPHTAEAIEDYISPDGNGRINGNLKKIRSGEKIDPHTDDQIDMLDFQAAHTKITKPAVLYRGFTAPKETLGQLTPGQEFEDHAFVSTAFHPKFAAMFALMRSYGRVPGPDGDHMPTVHAHGGVPTIMKINVPAGSGMFMGERDISEYVLPRNTKFRVTDVSPDGSLVTVDALPAGDVT